MAARCGLARTDRRVDTRPATEPLTSQLLEPIARARRPRTRWLEWCLLAVLLLAAVVALVCSRGLEHMDLALNDQLSRLGRQAVSPDIVIVAIDDQSLNEVGRWPWRRAIHAAALDQITAAGPRAVGLDLILVEPGLEDPLDDTLLADAMARNGKVVLPMVLMDAQGTGRLARASPVPELAASALATGHIHLEIDNDGIVRSTFLREGDGQTWWDHFSLAVLRAGGFAPAHTLPGLRAPAAHPPSPGAWQRDHWIQIPFAGPAGSFARVSYADVLKGKVPAAQLAGKYVLVGATAAGMGDAYATPRSGQAELMPGVEIAANVMNALLLDQRLVRASAWQNAWFTAVPVALALLAVLLLTPTASLLVSGALLLVILAATAAAPSALGVQFAPTAALLGVLLAYPLWVWRRLRAAMGYLLEEFQRMETRRELPTMLPAARSGDLLDRHIDALQNASAQLRNLNRFVGETLNSLPDATLIADANGQVLAANQAAHRYFADRQVARLRGQHLSALLEGVYRTGTAQQPVFDTERLAGEPEPWGSEARDADGRDLLVRLVPCFNTDGQTTSWIASLVDITPIREAERQRDVALRFISHDMRSPQSSILALLAVQRLDPDMPVPQDTLERIERHARRTLDLAEEFVQLARAESSAYQMSTADLVDLLDDAVDETWPQAQARGVRIEVQRPDGPALCEADRGLLGRALTNLLGNAVKYTAAHTTVSCGVQRAGSAWRVSVTDQGPGMTAEEQQRLFRPFSRLDHEQSAARGVGLGLAFVRTVVERHGGHIQVSSEPSRGSTFHFTLAASESRAP
jgi:CHASE2 domain-containing sensor protein/signal transduction histidine kinase